MKLLVSPIIRRFAADQADVLARRIIRQQRRWRHTVAIARELPNSFSNALSSCSPSSSQEEVSLERAREQHTNYVDTMRTYLPTLSLPPLEEHPDCLFVEDTVVAIGKRAVMTRPGHVSRQGEVDSMRDALRQFGMDVLDMRDLSSTAKCDGGDVLYTGRHLFVGVSRHRTNVQAVEVLRHCFPHIETVSVSVPQPSQQQQQQHASSILHLKSAVTHMDDSTLLVPQGPIGDEILESMQATKRGYQAVRLPDVLACNAVVLETTTCSHQSSSNNILLAQDTACPVSRQGLVRAAEERNMDLVFVDTSELAKKDAALTCCSVLLSL